MTAEWEEGELGGHRSSTQSSSLLLFLLVIVGPKRGEGSHFKYVEAL